MTSRRIPTLAGTQEAFHLGLGNERFSLENALRRYANSVTSNAVEIVVHTYPNSAAYEIEVLRPDGTTASVNTAPVDELRPKKAQI